MCIRDSYIEDYPAFIRGEVERVVEDFTTDATNTVNVAAVVRRLAPMLPLMAEIDRAELERLSPERLTSRLVALAHEQERQGTNLLQLFQAMGRFLPLVPAVPNLGALATHKSGQVQTRERLRGEYIAQVQSLYNEFLAETIDAADREPIWTCLLYTSPASRLAAPYRRAGRACPARRRREWDRW